MMATITSSEKMAMVNKIEIGMIPSAPPILSPLLPMMKINEIRDKTMKCPAEMFANNRMANAKGFTNKLMISMSVIKGTIAMGTPGMAKMCRQ